MFIVDGIIVLGYREVMYVGLLCKILIMYFKLIVLF